MVNGNSSLVFPPKSKQLTIIPETDIVLIEKRTKIRPSVIYILICKLFDISQLESSEKFSKTKFH